MEAIRQIPCFPSLVVDRPIARRRIACLKLHTLESRNRKLCLLQHRSAFRTFSYDHDGSAPMDVEPEDFYAEELLDACNSTDHESMKTPQDIATMLLDEEETLTSILDNSSTTHAQVSPKGGAKIHDFCLGIPYGGFLVAGGVVWYLITGSLSAIQFGFLLGGISLALSIASFNVWKKGKSSMSHIQGEAAISFLLAFLEAQRAYQKKTLLPAFVAIISAAMFLFFSYVFLSGGNPPKKKTA